MWRQGREGTHAATCQDHLEPLLPEAGRILPRSLCRGPGHGTPDVRIPASRLKVHFYGFKPQA